MATQVCSQQKRVGGGERAARHSFLLSETHKNDVERGVAVRKARAFRQYEKSFKARVLFPKREELSFTCNCVPRGKAFSLQNVDNEAEHVRHRRKLQEERSFYWTTTKSRHGKSKKRKWKKEEPLLQTDISLPPWWTKALGEAIASKKLSVADAQERLLALGKRVASVYLKRSGYELGWLCLHAESNENIHFELGFSTINKKNELIGRSADGKKGRKGFCMTHRSFLGLWRYDQIESDEVRLPEELLKAAKRDFAKHETPWTWEDWQDGRFDNIAAAGYLDDSLPQAEYFPEIANRANELAKEMLADAVAPVSSDTRKRFQQLTKEKVKWHRRATLAEKGFNKAVVVLPNEKIKEEFRNCKTFAEGVAFLDKIEKAKLEEAKSRRHSPRRSTGEEMELGI